MKIALLGIGTVGSSFKRIIDNKDDIEIKYILVKEPKGLANECMDINTILEDDEIEIVVELIGGIDIAYKYIKASLLAHKNVVSANKAVIALYLDELLRLAKDNGVCFNFEASSGGGMPIIEEILEYQKIDNINSFKGILNGTCNYILDSMSRNNLDYLEALNQAKDLGYAEKDPSSDVLGLDTQNKLAILAMLISHKKLKLEDIDTFGIDKISKLDIDYFKDYAIRLIAYYDKRNAFVIPTITKGIFKETKNNLNCFKYNSDKLKDLYIIGQGAGGDATASAVLRDVLNLKEIDLLDDEYLDIKNDFKANFYIRCHKDVDIREDYILDIQYNDDYKYIKTNKIEVRKIIREYKDKECFIALMEE